MSKNESFDENRFRTATSELKGYTDKKKMKYRRNYRRYCYSPTASLENIRNPAIIGYYQADDEFGGEEDTTPTPEINVVKSTIDTLTSKIAESKVRPFFNCVNGSFKDILIVKQAQQYFDLFYDLINANKTVSNAFRDACIFDTGWIYIDPVTRTVRRALPWHVHFRPAEMTYGKLTRIYYEQPSFPVSLLPDDVINDKNNKEALKNYEFITYGVYYDTFNHVKVIYISEINYVNIQDFDSDVLPFVYLHYNSPIMGDTSESIVDMLNSIQLEIDNLMTKISDASQLNAANTYFLPEGSSIKASQLSNRIGNVVTYKPTSNMTTSPVTVSTPAFINDQYMVTVEKLKQTAYEMVGISQLSAMSTKPTGLDSGIALQSMENIESDRFETQLNQVIRAYVDISKACIACFPQNEDILPENKVRRSIKWGDIVSESKNMTIQYSGADALSKDPSEKLKQLQMLAQAGVIPSSRIAQFIEIPDLQSGYSLTNNAINAVMTIIEKCINNDVFDVPEFIPFMMLKEEIINTQLSLYAANPDLNTEDIEKLNKLYASVEDKETEWKQTVDNINGAANDAAGDSPIPQQQNVLTQEAGMQAVPPQGAAPEAVPGNLDVAADGAQPGNWNAGA
jgi:hypothetical protein